MIIFETEACNVDIDGKAILYFVLHMINWAEFQPSSMAEPIVNALNTTFT